MINLIPPSIICSSTPTEVPLSGDLRTGVETAAFALLLGTAEGEAPTPETPPPLVPPPPPAVPTGSEEAILDEPNAREIQPDFFLPTESAALADEPPAEPDEAPEEQELQRGPSASTPMLVLADLLGMLPFTPAYAMPAAAPSTATSPNTVDPLAPLRPQVVASVLPAKDPQASDSNHGVELICVEQPESDDAGTLEFHPSVPQTGNQPATTDVTQGEPSATPNKSVTVPIDQESRSVRAFEVPAPVSTNIATPPAKSELEARSSLRTPAVTPSPPSPRPPQAPTMPMAGTGVLELLNPVEVRVREGGARLVTALAAPEATTSAPMGQASLSGPTQLSDGLSSEAVALTSSGKPVVPEHTTELPVTTGSAQEAMGSAPVERATLEAAKAPNAAAVMTRQFVKPDSAFLVTSLSIQSAADLTQHSKVDSDQADQSDESLESDTPGQPVQFERSHPSSPTSQIAAPTDQPRLSHRPKPAIEPEAISRRIADRIEELFSTRRGGTVTIQLDPKDLGSITLTVRSFGNRVDAEIGASHEGVRAALAENRQQLSQSIESRGLSLGQLSLSDHREFSQGTPWNRQDAREDLQRYANVRLADDPRPASSDATPWSIANDQSVDYRI